MISLFIIILKYEINETNETSNVNVYITFILVISSRLYEL